MSGLPFASVRQRLGLTRREQQVVPLIAKGLTNKNKIGAGDRFSIVQRYRTQGFLL
jgi:ATP/maltotriose-dependent transcriptional regulator MalT